MNRSLTFLALGFALVACTADDLDGTDETPSVTSDPMYEVIVDEDVVYAEGLAHSDTSTAAFAIPLLLDVYAPDSDAANRPVFMFVHGGGFTGGTKNKPEIEEMGEYFASRGWVFASIDYRTTEEMGVLTDSSRESVVAFYAGIAPEEWVQYALDAAEAGEVSSSQFQQAIAMYAAQRDAKAALRWVVDHANDYGMNPDFIAVGGASAGAITAAALGITDPEDFRDEIAADQDPTVSTASLDVMYEVQGVVSLWGSTTKLDLFEGVYGIDPYDTGDPELFLVHGTNDQNASTPYSESVEFQGIYNDLGIYSELVPLEGEGHGAWDAQVDGKGLFDLSFDFLVDRQGLNVER